MQQLTWVYQKMLICSTKCWSNELVWWESNVFQNGFTCWIPVGWSLLGPVCLKESLWALELLHRKHQKLCQRKELSHRPLPKQSTRKLIRNAPSSRWLLSHLKSCTFHCIQSAWNLNQSGFSFKRFGLHFIWKMKNIYLTFKVQANDPFSERHRWLWFWNGEVQWIQIGRKRGRQNETKIAQTSNQNMMHWRQERKRDGWWGRYDFIQEISSLNLSENNTFLTFLQWNFQHFNFALMELMMH